MNHTGRIAGAGGCELYTVGAQTDVIVNSMIIREDGTTISAIKLVNLNGYEITAKNYLNVELNAGELLTFEFPAVEFTISVGSVMAYSD